MLIQGMMLTVLWSARTASAGEFTGEAVSLQVRAIAVGDFDCSGVTDQAVVSRTRSGTW